MRIKSFLYSSLLLTALTGLASEDRDFGFRPLEIYKFDHGASRMIVEDLNGDGRDDILFSNNRVSRLEILLRKPENEGTDELPELEDRFEDKGILLDQSVRVLRVADLNNDNRKDIITFGTTLGIQIRYQAKDGTFNSPERVFVKDATDVETIKIGQLNDDQMKDILIIRQDRADLHWNSKKNPFREKKTISFSSDKCSHGHLVDINQDGKTDLAFYFSTLRNPLKVRFGKGDGLYSSEQPMDLPSRYSWHFITEDDAPPKVGLILRNRSAFRIYGFTEEERPVFLDAQELSPTRIGLEGTNKKTVPAWVASDFNDDRYDDFLVAAPELSRLHLYTGTKTGLDPEPGRIDSLSDIKHISQLANRDVLVVSGKEKTAAIHSFDVLEQFPTILQLPGDVLAGCAVETSNMCWFICKNESKEMNLVRTDQQGNAGTVFPLDLKNDPNDILAFTLPGNKTGLLFFMPYGTPKMFLHDGQELEELHSESFRALTQKLKPSNFHLEKKGDGSVLTVSQQTVSRRFHWTGTSYEVTRQLNPENPRSEIVASTTYRFLDGREGTLLYDGNSTDIIYFDKKDDEYGKIQIPDADQTIFNLVQLKNKKHDTVLLIDRTGINEIVSAGTRYAPISEAEYVSPSEDPALAYMKAIQLGSPLRPMIALTDHANRSYELISQDGETITEELIFAVFLESDFSTRDSHGSDPRNICSGDLNGDGIGDLAILSQDKLIIYLGE